MGVEILIVFMLGFYPLPTPPPARGGNDVTVSNFALMTAATVKPN